MNGSDSSAFLGKGIQSSKHVSSSQAMNSPFNKDNKKNSLVEAFKYGNQNLDEIFASNRYKPA